jgi:hypothetical protein
MIFGADSVIFNQFYNRMLDFLKIMPQTLCTILSELYCIESHATSTAHLGAHPSVYAGVVIKYTRTSDAKVYRGAV